jgi:cytochrome c553
MKRWLVRIGYGLAGLVVLALVVVAAAWVWSGRRMERRYAVAADRIVVPGDSAAVARGRHVARAVGMCTDCHGDDFGGKVMIDDPLMGRLVASNLTRGRGGVGGRYTDADWLRAILHGIRADGRSLVYMPAQMFRNLGDEDVAALVAYLKTLPPVDREQPATRVGLIARMAHVSGSMQLLPAELIAHDSPRPAAPPAGATVAYGEHLTRVAGCRACHGMDLSGQSGAMPGAANLTPAGRLGSWSEADFVRVLRTGVRPDGSALAKEMPWRVTSRMTDEELGALWMYLRTVPAKAGKQRA